MPDRTSLDSPAVRDLTRELAALTAKVERLERGQRTSQLGNSSIEDGYLSFNDGYGVQRVTIGRQVDGKFGWGAVNGEPTPRPNTPQLIGTTGGVAIVWNGSFAGPQPSDFAYTVAHLSPAGPDFAHSDDNIVGRMIGAQTLPVTAIKDAELTSTAQYWCKLVSYNTSGLPSDVSLVAGPATPLEVFADDVRDGVITRVKMAEDAVDAAVLAAQSVGLEHVTFTAQDLGSIVTYAQATAPAPTQSAPIPQGSLWMDTDDGNKLYRWNGLQWAVARDSDIAAALAAAQQAASNAAAALDAAADAEAKADGVVDIFYSSTAPSGAKVGDLWFNEAAGNKVSKWTGSVWSPIDDNRIGQALANAQTAQTTADGKIRSFYAATAPSGAGVGDLWYDTGNGNRPSRWNGSGWTPLPAGTAAISDNAITTSKVVARAIQALQIAVETILAENIATDAVDARIIKALSILAEHIAANQIEAGHIKAGAITAEHLEAVLVLASRLIAGNPDDWHLELGDSQTPILYWNGVETGFAVSRDQTTGQANVYMSGRVEFGNGSQIEQDYLDLCEQASTGFQTPTLRQSRTLIYSQPVAVPAPQPSWLSATGKNNLLYMSVLAANTAGSGAPVITVPAAWQLITTVVGGASGSTRLSTYRIPGSVHTVSRTAEAISANVPCAWSIGLAEPIGIQTTGPLDVFASSSGSGGTASTGTTGTPAQGNEFQIATFATPGAGAAGKSGFSAPTNGFSIVTQGGGFSGQGSAMATKIVTGALPASAQATVSPANPWLATVATFRTALAAPVPAAPPERTVRLFTQQRGGASTPFVIDSALNVYPVGRVPYCKVRLTSDVFLTANLDVYAQGSWVSAGDPWGMVAISSSAGTFSNITIPFTGLYRVDYKVIFQSSSNTTSTVSAFVTKNGRDAANNSIARDARKYVQDGGDGTPVQASRELVLQANDQLFWGNFSSVNTNFYTGRLNIPTEITVTYMGVGG